MNNNLLSRRTFMKSLVLTIAGASSYKVLKATAQTPNNDDLIENLASRYFVPLNSAIEAEEWLQSWRSLSFEQVEAFNESVTRYALEQGRGKEANIVTRVDIAKKMRSDINKKSMELYGVPFNQLSGEEFNEVNNAIWKSGYSDLVKDTLDNSTLAACSCYTYPYTTVPGGSGSPTNNTGRIRAANSGECNDCDLEVIFPVNRQILRHVTPAGYVYYWYTSGYLLLRRSPTTSRILIGYNAVLSIFLGSEYAAQIAYRLD